MAHPLEETAPQARRRRAESWLVPIGIPVVLVASLLFTQWRFGNVINETRADDRAAAEVSRLATCRGRNSGNAAGRSDSGTIVDAFRRYTVDDPEAQAFIQNDVTPKMSTPSDVDQDCNRNGVLDVGDYADVVPPQLADPAASLPPATLPPPPTTTGG